MPTTIAENSVNVVKKLIRQEFDKSDWWSEKQELLIKTARDFGLLDLADEMQNDLNY